MHRFRPSTSFAELDPEGSTVALMRNPLMLRLLMAAFNRRPLPSDLCFDDAMSLYFEHVVIERDAPGGAYKERGAFLQRLVRALDAAGTASLDREQLHEIGSLQAAMRNPQRDSAYVQLLELGILIEGTGTITDASSGSLMRGCSSTCSPESWRPVLRDTATPGA